MNNTHEPRKYTKKSGNKPLDSVCKVDQPVLLPKNSAKIYLTRNLFAIVDSDKVDELSQWSWCAAPDYQTYYAVRGYKNEQGKQVTVRMHRYLMNAPSGRGIVVDHINGNGLDNRICNLRIVNHRINQLNRKPKQKKPKSSFVGVSYRLSKICGWVAHINVNGSRIKLGEFGDEIAAAVAYDKAALMYFGKDAVTNASLGIYFGPDLPLTDLDWCTL